MRQSPRRRLLFFLLAAVVLFCVDFCAFPYGQPPAGRSANTGENGLWLHFSWYAGEYSEDDTRRLALRLANAQARYVYCHVRGVQQDGRLRFH